MIHTVDALTELRARKAGMTAMMVTAVPVQDFSPKTAD